nr:Ig-like domain-containing domain [uncultured Chitinophaga sp.]
MYQYIRSWAFWLISFMMAVSMTRCANIVPPGGGPRDSLPPSLAAVNPPDSSLHFKNKKVYFVFDEFVELDNVNDKLIVSPTLKRTPIITAKLRTVTMELKDTLQENTTYTFNFSDAIRDINERNAIPDFQYVVSTGNYLDSLQLTGHMIDAENGVPDSNIAVMLYRNLEDSIVSKEKPVYYAKTRPDGSFRFKNMAPGTYKLFALKEEDRDLQYNQPSEMIAFVEKPIVMKEQNAEGVNLLLFMERDSTIKEPLSPQDSLDQANQALEEQEREKEKEKDKKKKTPKLQITPTLDGGLQELPAPLQLSFNLPLRTLDSARVILGEDSTFTRVTFHTSMDSTHTKLTVFYPWKEGTPYRMIFPADAATDTTGQQLPKADTISFKSKKSSDYAIFGVTLKISDSTRQAINDDSMHYVIQLVQDKAIKYSGTAVNGTWLQKFITPGEYEVRVLLDANGNGKWDRGQYYKEPKRQPERVILVPGKQNLKAYWTLRPTIEI